MLAASQAVRHQKTSVYVRALVLVCQPAPLFSVLIVQHGKDAVLFNLACSHSNYQYETIFLPCIFTLEFLKWVSHGKVHGYQFGASLLNLSNRSEQLEDAQAASKRKAKQSKEIKK